EDDISQSELSARVSVSQSTTIAALRKLEQQDLVTLTRDERDRRSIRVGLTEKGRSLKEEMLPRVEEINKILLHGLSDEEASELLRLLRKVGDNARANAS